MTRQNSIEAQSYGPSQAPQDGAIPAQHLQPPPLGHVVPDASWKMIPRV
jgi:hypothetical protein